MASPMEEEVNWQSTKETVLERSRYMFDNPFLSDISFTSQDSQKTFFAHKHVLATSSEVFQRMFYGELAEQSSTVHLSDADEDSLAEFLRFIYTDECELTPDNAVDVLYLAKKYFVPCLAQKCSKLLEANISEENAFVILEQAIQFDEQILEKKCWQLIDSHTSEVLAAVDFAYIDQTTLVQFLKRKTLNVDEVELFQAVLKWSEAECARKGRIANAGNQREVLGNAIYEIRFGSMTLQEFAQNTFLFDLLLPFEKVLFYERFGGIARVSEVWNLSKREATQNEATLLRCSRFPKDPQLYPRADRRNYLKAPSRSDHIIGILFSKAVKIHGVRMLGNEGSEYDLKLEICSQIIENKFLSEQREDSAVFAGFDVMLVKPITVQPDVLVHLKATVCGPNSLIRAQGKKTSTINDVIVHFIMVPVLNNSTRVDRGQFHEIIFSEI